MPVLMVERGADKGATLKLEEGTSYVIGRDHPKAAMKIADVLASRAHFEVKGKDGKWYIRDLKSRNGTLLNDELLTDTTPIDIGDKVQAGDTILSFLSDQKEESKQGGLIGKTIGGYEVLERLGRGGMGTVYKATQLSLNRTVALKVLSAKLMADPTFVDKFVEEAKAAGQMNHPNIVQVFDVATDRGLHIFSMELMEHESVGDRVSREGPIPWDRALEMMTDAAKGLIFAEKRGIIHRDIKPDNLMLTPEGTVKIGDLGLAKKAEETSDGGGAIFGTPHFIAPEQAQGKPIDNRADLYSLGATFYRILSGKTPFTGENVKEILLHQIHDEPPPLDQQVEDVAPEVVAVVRKLMQKNPDDRYRSAEGLLEDLERIRVRYHLESHGAAASAKRTKIIAGVLALAVVGIGAVAFHFANKDPEIVTIDNTRDPVDVGPVNTGPSEEEIRAEAAKNGWTQLENAYLQLQVKAKGDPAATWKSHEKDWLALADRIEEFAAKFKGLPQAGQAGKRTTAIRTAIADAKATETRAQEAAAKAWSDFLAEIDGLVAAGSIREALDRLTAGPLDLAEQHGDWLPKDMTAVVDGRRKGIVDAVTERFGTLVKELEEVAGRFPGDAWLAARGKARALKQEIAVPPDAEGEAADLLRALVGKIDAALLATKATALTAARAAVDADRAAYVRTYLAVRRWSPPDTPPEAASTAFFDYRWDECLEKWKALRATLKTSLWQERVDGKIAQYERCKRFFARLIVLVNEEGLRPGFPEVVKRGATVTLNRAKQPTADATGVHVLKQRGSRREFLFVEWRELSPREIYVDFLERGEDAPLAAEDHLDLAVFLAEAGEGDVAGQELGAALGSTPAAELPPDLEQWLRRESNIAAEYTNPGGIQALFEQYRAARLEGLEPAIVEQRRRKVERAMKEFMGAERFVVTDYSLLHRSTIGPEAPPPDHLFPAAAVTRFVRSLGVSSAESGNDDPEKAAGEDDSDGNDSSGDDAGATDGTGGTDGTDGD